MRITSSYFCAGVVIGSLGWVIKAAPILKYMKGWSEEAVRKYCIKKGWKIG